MNKKSESESKKENKPNKRSSKSNKNNVRPHTDPQLGLICCFDYFLGYRDKLSERYKLRVFDFVTRVSIVVPCFSFIWRHFNV